MLGEGGVGEPFVCEVYECVRPAEAYGRLVPVKELFEGVRVAFVPLSRQVVCRGVFALPQRCEEFVEVHGGVPFLLRCWLITSIGEDPTLVRSRWAKEETPPARDVQGGFSNEPYLKEDFPSFPDSSIHFAGSLT